jgi:hypothetical protein
MYYSSDVSEHGQSTLYEDSFLHDSDTETVQNGKIK